jgi:hypothetical protein
MTNHDANGSGGDDDDGPYDDEYVDALLKRVEIHFPNCADEVQAIVYTYREMARVRYQALAPGSRDRPSLTITAHLAPRGADAGERGSGIGTQFCSATVILKITTDYPNVPAGLVFRNVRGLKTDTEAAFRATLQVRRMRSPSTLDRLRALPTDTTHSLAGGLTRLLTVLCQPARRLCHSLTPSLTHSLTR